MKIWMKESPAGYQLSDNPRHDKGFTVLFRCIGQSPFPGERYPNLIVAEGIDHLLRVGGQRHPRGIQCIQLSSIREDGIEMPGHALHLSGGQIQTGQLGHMLYFFLSYFHDFAKEKTTVIRLFAPKQRQLLFIQRTGGKDNPCKDFDEIGIKL
jgi:hypothetical protein